MALDGQLAAELRARGLLHGHQRADQGLLWWVPLRAFHFFLRLRHSRFVLLGVPTSAGRKSTLKLAHRMVSSFCKAIGASSFNTWTKISTKNGDDVRISSRRNLRDQREPLGSILSAVSSFWMPIPAAVLFDFLRDDARKSQVGFAHSQHSLSRTALTLISEGYLTSGTCCWGEEASEQLRASPRARIAATP